LVAALPEAAGCACTVVAEDGPAAVGSGGGGGGAPYFGFLELAPDVERGAGAGPAPAPLGAGRLFLRRRAASSGDEHARDELVPGGLGADAATCMAGAGG
jgi:hypothetical protein